VGRVIRALKLSSQPPKAGVRFPSELAIKLATATTANLTTDALADRWVAVLEAAAFSPVRSHIQPAAKPAQVNDELLATVKRVGPLLPQIAALFDIEVSQRATAPKPLRPTRPAAPKKPPRAPAPPPRAAKPAAALAPLPAPEEALVAPETEPAEVSAAAEPPPAPEEALVADLTELVVAEESSAVDQPAADESPAPAEPPAAEPAAADTPSAAELTPAAEAVDEPMLGDTPADSITEDETANS
jgi:hypothetical protein